MSDSPENPHPLDEALRRHLSSYGETPSPRVWAGVRGQLPGRSAAQPVPRWRRPARRLSVLLGLLLSLVAGVWLLTDPLNPLARRPRPSAAKMSQPAGAQRRGQPLTTAQPKLAAGSGSGQAGADLTTSLPPAERGTSPKAASNALPHLNKNKQLAAVESIPKAPLGSADVVARAVPRPGSAGPFTTATNVSPVADSSGMESGLAALAATTEVSPQTVNRAALSALTKRPDRRPENLPGSLAPPKTVKLGIVAAATGRTLRPAAPETSGAETVTLGLESDNAPDANNADSQQETSNTLATTPLPTEQLAFKLVLLPQAGPLGTRPEALAFSSDSARQTGAAKRRRWALQAVAGPTLSYRTLRQPWRAGPAELAQLERPGLGWGAQVQVHRVLSGRWALAAGLGFQQYATQSGKIKSPASVSYLAWQVASAAPPRRDTYNLLLLPVQVSYALGSFGPRWQVAAVAGVEPGRYLGGRSPDFTSNGLADNLTPATSPNSNSVPGGFYLNQRTYTSAEASPYRAWNLGLSLGLDLRYQLAPASRWQVLAQPTVRSLVSPFAQANAADYSRRPFSLGGLAGLSWNLTSMSN